MKQKHSSQQRTPSFEWNAAYRTGKYHLYIWQKICIYYTQRSEISKQWGWGKQPNIKNGHLIKEEFSKDEIQVLISISSQEETN